MKTTLQKIRAKGPCQDGWENLLSSLGKTKADDEVLSIITVLDSNGTEDAIWALRAVDVYLREIRLFAVWCARQVEHLFTDEDSKRALDVAERFANGMATEIELDEARADAWRAACRADFRGASRAAWSAAYFDAYHATRAAAYFDVYHAARTNQAKELRRICEAIDRGVDPYPYTPRMEVAA